ncbi:MAG: O-antigen ligase family protein [Gemmatimonadetes bacterium]|nr:O-antigen ligase family protein [Gemmatimonadota bacterium]
MMTLRVDLFDPAKPHLLVLVCFGQILLIALPFLVNDALAAILVLSLLSAIALFGSLTLSVLYLCFTAAVVPSWFYEDYLTLPLDFKFYEGLLVVVMGIAWLNYLLEGQWNWRRHTFLDRPMCVLLGLVIFSCLLGLIYGQSISQMLRDVRYPLYYTLFFVVTWFFDVRRFSTFLHLFLLIAAIVGIEYLFEFLLQVDTDIAGGFVRVARLEGIVLPMGMFIIAAILLFEARAYRRAWAWGAILPIGLALVLTMGRGMWISLFVGLGSLGALTALDKQAPPRRLSRLFVVVLIPLLLLAMGYIFQQQTRAAVSDIALDRVTRSVEAVGGRLISYGNALEKIRQRPLLGGGHGETVTSLVTFPPPPQILTVGAVDNVYLTIGLRMGLVGVAAFLWVFGFALWRAYLLFQQSSDARVRLFCAAFIAIYAALLVYGMADATLFANRLIFIHATFLGLIARLVAEEKNNA